MRKVIVTGANGFIGSLLIKKLIEKKVMVVAIARSFADFHLPQSKYITLLETGLDDIEKLQRIIGIDEYDAFYHFAWQGVNGADKTNLDIQLNNIRLVMNCANVAKKVGCKKILCSGTIAEQSINSLPNLNKTRGAMMYGVAKYCTHMMLETYCKYIGLDFVWMQFSNIYGPGNKTGNLIGYTIKKIMNDQEAAFGPALQPYDFIYDEDLIEAVLRLGENKTAQNCYFIGSGEPRILKDYLMEIGTICGKENFIKIGSREDDGIVYTMNMFDISSLVEDIGNYVSMPFAQGIKNTLEDYNL